MPSADALDHLTHVRRADDETAVVIAKRLPGPKVSSTAHLVSVEHIQHISVATSMSTWKRLRAMGLGRDEPADHPSQDAEIDDTMPPNASPSCAADLGKGIGGANVRLGVAVPRPADPTRSAHEDR